MVQGLVTIDGMDGVEGDHVPNTDKQLMRCGTRM